MPGSTGSYRETRTSWGPAIGADREQPRTHKLSDSPPEPPQLDSDVPPGPDVVSLIADLSTAIGLLSARVATLENATPLVAVPSHWQDFVKRLTSRKFLMTLAAEIYLAIQWANGSLHGAAAGGIIAGLGLVYVLVQGYIDKTPNGAIAGAVLTTRTLDPIEYDAFSPHIGPAIMRDVRVRPDVRGVSAGHLRESSVSPF